MFAAGYLCYSFFDAILYKLCDSTKLHSILIWSYLPIGADGKEGKTCFSFDRLKGSLSMEGS